MNLTFKLALGIFLLLTLSCKEQHLFSDQSELATVTRDFEDKQKAIPHGDLFRIFTTSLTAEEREALMFLYAYMPIGDITDYSGNYYLMNVRYALKARQEMPWGNRIPEREFRHFVLPVRVNNESKLRNALHIFDTPQGEIEFVKFTLESKNFFFGIAVDCAVSEHLFQFFETVNAFLNGNKVGKRTAHPTESYIWLTCSFSFLCYSFLSLTFCADEKNFAAVGNSFNDFVVSCAEKFYSLLQVNDMYTITSAKNVRTHFWIPATGLVTKMYTSFEHLFHAYVSHDNSSKVFFVHFHPLLCTLIFLSIRNNTVILYARLSDILGTPSSCENVFSE